MANEASFASVTREGQEDQLGTLGLVVNMIVLWNTIYMTEALKQLKRQGYQVLDDDVAVLSPWAGNISIC